MEKNHKIITVYNRYLNRGGEDEVFELESELLENKGWEVLRVEEQVEIPGSMNEKVSMAIDAVWSRSWYKKFSRLLSDNSPAIVHIHNFFPNFSPSIYYACNHHGIPVVQTLHNYRLICPNALLFRNGNICEDCIEKSIKWPAIKYSCYKDSRLQSSVLAAMLKIHSMKNTWQDMVDAYIALSDFSRDKLIQGGLPESKIFVKPNFLSPDPGFSNSTGKYFLYVGRLSTEKGIHTLINAIDQLTGIPVKIVGDGPFLEPLRDIVKGSKLQNIEVLGRLSKEKVIELMKGATSLIFPSHCFENMPMTIIEAYACGVPVIASRLGAMNMMVSDGHTGLLFTPGNGQDLAAKVQWARSHPQEIAEMGKNARREYEEKYTAERNYELLMGIYEKALKGKKRGGSRAQTGGGAF